MPQDDIVNYVMAALAELWHLLRTEPNTNVSHLQTGEVGREALENRANIIRSHVSFCRAIEVA